MVLTPQCWKHAPFRKPPLLLRLSLHVPLHPRPSLWVCHSHHISYPCLYFALFTLSRVIFLFILLLSRNLFTFVIILFSHLFVFVLVYIHACIHFLPFLLILHYVRICLHESRDKCSLFYRHMDLWEKCFQLNLLTISQKSKSDIVKKFFTHYKESYKGFNYDSDRPPSRSFANCLAICYLSCELFARFNFYMLIRRQSLMLLVSGNFALNFLHLRSLLELNLRLRLS